MRYLLRIPTEVVLYAYLLRSDVSAPLNGRELLLSLRVLEFVWG